MESGIVGFDPRWMPTQTRPWYLTIPMMQLGVHLVIFSRSSRILEKSRVNSTRLHSAPLFCSGLRLFPPLDLGIALAAAN
jgi:hypothetical protein